ncbi:MAG: hypothetical protein E6767_00800 [Dysgonomonas sp.]|nr:hypothetical protein [Dysgonomonas sp.]
MEDIENYLYKTVNVSHPIYHFASKGDVHFGCCSEYGIVTILDENFNIRNVVNCADTIKWGRGIINVFGFHSCADVFYIGGEEEYRIYDLNGKLLCSVPEKVDAVHYSKQRNKAWVVKRINSAEKEVCLIVDDAQSDSIRIEDELIDSIVELHPSLGANKISMKLTTNKDRYSTYILSDQGGEIIIQDRNSLDMEDCFIVEAKYLKSEREGNEGIGSPYLHKTPKYLITTFKENSTDESDNSLIVLELNNIGE